MNIDAHHHLWRYTPEEYGWIDDRLQALRRDFLPEDLRAELQTANIDATIAVQARQSIEETHWLLDLATENTFIQGVVGWAPIAADDFSAMPNQLLQNPLLKGLRHIVQGEADGFLDDLDFNRGIKTLTETGLAYDVLVFSHQLGEVIRFIDRHPNQSFVLDHIAKPEISANRLEPWNQLIHELARRDNVVCKLSGMVTEANSMNWTGAALRPYFEIVLDAFGPGRIMFGSDWPVLTAACSYRRWSQTVAEWIAPLSATEQREIMGDVAIRIYRLDVKSQRNLTSTKD
jgi:L-fuconolactonase